MSILNFQKPDEVIMINEEANQGNFEFCPLEPGYGLTVGDDCSKSKIHRF